MFSTSATVEQQQAINMRNSFLILASRVFFFFALFFVDDLQKALSMKSS
jgi:hypothetical protein